MAEINTSQYDKRLYDTVWGESAGGSPAEIVATAAIYDNLAKQYGYEKALLKSNAYRKESPQYLKASTGKMNSLEKIKYAYNKMLIDNYLKDPNLPYTAHENVKEFGDPSWASSFGGYQDIGRQRFYYKPKVKAMSKGRK